MFDNPIRESACAFFQNTFKGLQGRAYPDEELWRLLLPLGLFKNTSERRDAQGRLRAVQYDLNHALLFGVFRMADTDAEGVFFRNRIFPSCVVFPSLVHHYYICRCIVIRKPDEDTNKDHTIMIIGAE